MISIGYKKLWCSGRGVSPGFFLCELKAGVSPKAWEPILTYISLENPKSLNDLREILVSSGPNGARPKMSSEKAGISSNISALSVTSVAK
jgi:hypothetical protein